MNKTNLEKEHYDNKAGHISSADSPGKNIYDELLQAAHIFYEQEVMTFLSQNKTGKILDYGCGTGIRTLKFACEKWELTGIDISSKSIEIAKASAGDNPHAHFIYMDCEKMEFADNSFDLILDYGTLSSLDLTKAMPEIIRVLKPSGSFIAIETLGHNPLFNLKRRMNVQLRKRTSWAAQHIMKLDDWAVIKNNYSQSEMYFFGLFTPILVLLNPFRKVIKIQTVRRHLEKLDEKLLGYTFFRKFAFKVVAVLKQPKK